MFIRTEILNRNMLCYTQNNKPIDTNKLAPINQSFWQEFRSLFQDLKKNTRSLAALSHHMPMFVKISVQRLLL